MTETGSTGLVDRLRRSLDMAERDTYPILNDDLALLLAVVEAAQQVAERGEERLIGTRIYMVPWADVHTLRETLAALHSQASDEGKA